MKEIMPRLGLAMRQGRCKVEVDSDDLRTMTFAAGGRAWVLHFWEDRGWVIFRCQLVPVADLPDDVVASLLEFNERCGLARLAIDRFGYVTFAAELPAPQADTDDLLSFAARFHVELDDALTDVLPHIPGRADASFVQPPKVGIELSARARWEVDPSSRPAHWSAHGRLLQVDLDHDDWITIAAATEPVERTPDLVRYLLITQAGYTITKLIFDEDNRVLAVANWPPQLMVDELFELLVNRVALDANALEQDLG